MHIVHLIIWWNCIQRQCLVLATFTSISLAMCSLWWVIAGYWKMSSAIQSIRICEIVQGYWLLCEQEMFYDELVGYKFQVLPQLASQMPRDTIEELRKALNRIREENNRIKICLNRYWTQVEIWELVECKLYEQAQNKQSFLTVDIYQSNVEMSDEK